MTRFQQNLHTIVPITSIPEYTLVTLSLDGKWGSGIPVIGFLSTAGARAANVGRGRSTSLS